MVSIDFILVTGVISGIVSVATIIILWYLTFIRWKDLPEPKEVYLCRFCGKTNFNDKKELVEHESVCKEEYL